MKLLEKATHSSTLAGKFHGRRTLVGSSPWGHTESDATKRLHFHFSLSCIGEGNGNPLQCSCLENPSDGGAWWAAIYGVAQSQTRLKRLSSSMQFFGQTISEVTYPSCCSMWGRTRCLHVLLQGCSLWSCQASPLSLLHSLLKRRSLLWTDNLRLSREPMFHDAFCLLILASIGDLCLWQLSVHVGRSSSGWFYMSATPSVLINWNSVWFKSFFFSFICLCF